MNKTLLIVVLSLLFTACSKSGSGSVEDDSKRVFSDKNQAMDIFARSTVQCPSGDCPEFTAGLYIWEEDFFGFGVNTCSGTLIAPNKLLTNRHCLTPAELSQPGESCSDKIKIYFPATKGLKEERHECLRVEALSAKYSEHVAPDWAVISLKTNSFRTPVKMNTGGVAENSKVKVYKVDFDLYSDKEDRGSVVEASCLANSNHYFANRYIGSGSAVSNFSACSEKILKGNSGSGVLNQNNELIAILSFAYMTIPGSPEMKTYPWLKQDSAGGTNIACIPYGGNVPRAMCEYDSEFYKPLAVAYAKLRGQMSHPNFYENQGVFLVEQKSQNKDNVIMSSDVLRLSQNFQRQSLTSMESAQSFVATQYIQSMFSQLPECVNATAPDKFKFSQEVLIQKGKTEVDPETSMQSRSSELIKAKVVARKIQGSNEYSLKFHRIYHFRDSDQAQLIFGYRNFSEMSYQIPVCFN